MSELYNLPDGWKWKTFDEVSTFIRGITFKPNQKFEEPDENTIFCFRTTNIQSELDDSDLLNIDSTLVKSDEKIIINGDILISSANSLELLGKCCLIKNINYKATLGGFIVCGRANKKILETKYYYYFFSSETNQNKMRNLANKTTGIANLPIKKVEKEYIPIPPLSEQQRIVSKLDLIFEKIDKSIALHQKNMDEANAFMGSVLNDVFGELEEKYDLKSIGSFSKVGTGVTPLKNRNDFYDDGNINWITSKATNNDYVFESEQLITKVALEECRLKINPIGTIIVALYGQGKTRGQVSELMVESTTNQALATIVVDENQAMNTYLKYFLKKSYLDIRRKASGGTQPNLNLSIIKSIELPLPPLNIQQKIVKYLDEISQKTEKIKQAQKDKMNSLKALKASILDQAFKGEL